MNRFKVIFVSALMTGRGRRTLDSVINDKIDEFQKQNESAKINGLQINTSVNEFGFGTGFVVISYEKEEVNGKKLKNGR